MIEKGATISIYFRDEGGFKPRSNVSPAVLHVSAGSDFTQQAPGHPRTGPVPTARLAQQWKLVDGGITRNRWWRPHRCSRAAHGEQNFEKILSPESKRELRSVLCLQSPGTPWTPFQIIINNGKDLTVYKTKRLQIGISNNL